MSAYRRLNRTCRTITFQHPTYAVFQSTPINTITNGISSSDNDVSDELINNSSASCGIRANNTSNNDKMNVNATNAMTTCNDLNHNNNVSANNSSSDDQQVHMVNSTTNFPSQPKHIRFPDVPYHSELLNELLVFAYTIMAAAMQFMHLYRTVWWLPESNTNQTMNFYLIDMHLTMFIVILLGRRFAYCFLIKVLELVCPRHFHQTALKIIRFSFFISILLVLGFLCIKMFHKQRYVVVYLCYPLIVYVITFGLRIEPFLRTIFELDDSPYFNGIPSHSCSTNPITIRAEIDVLRADYNNRFKQVVFTSLLNAYYAAFIPCCFAQSYLYYDLYWATQHLGFLVLGGFTMCTMCCFPANYCDVMHMASLHLGKWVRIESRSYAPPAIVWSKLVVWPPGVFVKHSGELYKACGIVTTAIPANGIHRRFYMFFQNPANIYLILSIVQSIIVLLQVIILFMVVEWHNIISLSYLLLFNYYILFKIVRDFVITNRMYMHYL